MKDASPQPRETLWVAEEGTQAWSSPWVWVRDPDGQGRRTARDRCSQSLLVFQKIANERPAVWFPLCRLWMSVLLVGVVLVVVLFLLFVVFRVFKHTVSELIEEKVFNVCNYWEFEGLFFHVFISEQIIFNCILPKYHFSKAVIDIIAVTKLKVTRIVLKGLYFLHIQKTQFAAGPCATTDLWQQGCHCAFLPMYKPYVSQVSGGAPLQPRGRTGCRTASAGRGPCCRCLL